MRHRYRIRGPHDAARSSADQDWAEIVLGVFVVLGAPTIASGFLSVASGSGASEHGYNPAAYAHREELPPADMDAYTGASMRRR